MHDFSQVDKPASNPIVVPWQRVRLLAEPPYMMDARLLICGVCLKKKKAKK